MLPDIEMPLRAEGGGWAAFCALLGAVGATSGLAFLSSRVLCTVLPPSELGVHGGSSAKHRKDGLVEKVHN